MNINPSCPSPGEKEKNDFFLFFFNKALKVFIKPFEAPQRNVKIKIYANFYFHTTFWNAQDGKVKVAAIDMMFDKE